MSAPPISAEVRTRMEGGVEQLEALLAARERLHDAIHQNIRLTQALSVWRENEARIGDAVQRAQKFAELTPLISALDLAGVRLDAAVTTALKELQLDRSPSLSARLDALAPHLPIIFRGTLDSSSLVWGGVVLASLFGAASVMTTWPWLAAAPIAAGIGGLLWDRARSRSLLVSQRLMIIGPRSVPLSTIRYIVVPRGVGAYRCKLEVEGSSYVDLPVITGLLDTLREAGVEVRYE
jgi:hypothetical protein